MFSVVRVGVKVNSENMGRPSIECRFLSRVEYRGSRVEESRESMVEGLGSRDEGQEGRGSRVKVQVILKNNKILCYIIILICYANRVDRLFSTFSPCAFVSNPMEKRPERFGYEVTINPLGEGDFFHTSAAKALGIETQGLDSRPSTIDILPSILDPRQKPTLPSILYLLF